MSNSPNAPGDRLLTSAPRNRWPAAIAGLAMTLVLVSVSAVTTVLPLVAPKDPAPLGHSNLSRTSLRMSRAYFFYAKWYQGYEPRMITILADAR